MVKVIATDKITKKIKKIICDKVTIKNHLKFHSWDKKPMEMDSIWLICLVEGGKGHALNLRAYDIEIIDCEPFTVVDVGAHE